MPQVREAIPTTMEEMIVGSKSPAEALDDAEEVTDIIRRYNRRLR